MTPTLSIIIPSRQERFFQHTIDDILAKARGDIEILQVLDGYWPTVPLSTDPRVHTLHNGDPEGMRPAINAAVSMAKGQYLMKIDAHCMLAEGFDVTLLAEIEDNWIVVPRRYALEPETWTIDATNSKYPVDYHYLSYPYERPGDKTCGLHGTPWKDRRAARAEVLLDDEMSSQGSCWVMSRAHWNRLGDMECHHYGNFIHEFQELGLKTWLGGGAVKVNKKTWYAHLYKGRKYGRGYILGPNGHTNGSDFTTMYWMGNQWQSRTRDLRWLIEKFAPVPTWPADLDAAFQPPTTTAPVSTEPKGKVWTHVTERTRAGFTRVDLAQLIASMGLRKGAEIGVADGRYSLVLCQHIPDIHLLCVDPWQPYEGNPRGGGRDQHAKNFELAQSRLSPYGAQFCRKVSADALADVPNGSLDFVYIDGHHGFDYVMADLIGWSTKVRSGGIVAGHDFYHFKNSGVIEAVEAYTKAHGITEWWTCDEREPSFWWVKP